MSSVIPIPSSCSGHCASRRARWLVAAGCLAAAAAACGESSPSADGEATFQVEAIREDVDRSILARAWDTVMSVGASMEDTVFLRPAWIIASAGGPVYAVDDIDQQLVAMDRRGRVLWEYGGRGRGPGEFAGIRDLDVGTDGSVHILDGRNERITVVDSGGREIRTVSLGQGAIPAPEELVALSDGTYIVVSALPRSPIVRVDGTGEVLDRAPMPWPRFSELHPLAAQGVVASDPGSDRWVYALALGDGWIPFRHMQPGGRMYRYVEHAPVPEVQYEATSGGRRSRLGDYVDSANGAFLSGSDLYVLFGGRSEWAGSVVDRYSFSDGSYAGSYVLPTNARALAVADSTFFVARWHPYPALLGLRPRVRSRTAPDDTSSEGGSR